MACPSYRINYMSLTTLLLFVFIIVTGCDTAKNRAKKIVSLRSERREMFDKLYREYGGSELSQAIKSELQKEAVKGNNSQNQVAQVLENFTQGADRDIFEQNMRIVGSGENLIAISEKAKQFFSRPDVQENGKKIYTIDIELEQLEKKEN